MNGHKGHIVLQDDPHCEAASAPTWLMSHPAGSLAVLRKD